MDEAITGVGPEVRHTELRVHLTVISLHEGDITEADVDAVVNAANTQLILGGGVAGAIRDKGGPSIQEECNRLSPIATGSAVITGAGRLRARHVIHAVGPRAGEGDEAALLASATRAVLEVATHSHLTSVALTALSTGIFGVAKDVCAHAMLAAIVDFLQTHETSLRRLEFCLRGADTMQVFQAELQRWRDRLERREKPVHG